MLHRQPFTRFSVYGSCYHWQIAMVSPGMTCCEHTLNTLRYADRYACAEKLYIWNVNKHISKAVKEINNVESLRFTVAQFSWYLLVSFPHKFTSSMKTNLERVSFITETEIWCIHEITSPRLSKKPTIHEKLVPTNLHDSTVMCVWNGHYFCSLKHTNMYMNLWMTPNACFLAEWRSWVQGDQ